jgi:antitoxin ParD1/3/4
MEVPISPEMERWIAAVVEAGHYEDASEVLYQALLQLKEREEDPAARLDALRRAVRKGAEQADRGELIDGEEAFRRVLDWIAEPQEKTA